MLAGFGTYATAVLDYQSPLRNFGEVLAMAGWSAPPAETGHRAAAQAAPGL